MSSWQLAQSATGSSSSSFFCLALCGLWQLVQDSLRRRVLDLALEDVVELLVAAIGTARWRA